MKRLLSLILLITSVLLLLTSCSNNDNDVPAGMKIGDKTSEYIFYVPEGWVVQPKSNQIALAYASTADKSCVYISVGDISGESIEEYWQRNLPEFSSYDSDARSNVFTFFNDSIPYRAMQCFCINDNRIFTLTYLAKDESKYGLDTYYNENISYAESVRENFKLVTDGEISKDEKTPFEDKNTPNGMMLISDTSIVKYKLYVPTDWKIDMQTGYTSAYNDGDKTSVGVSYFVPSSNNIPDYFESLKKQYKKIYTFFDNVEQKTISNPEIQFLTYIYDAVYGGKSIKVMQAFTIEGSYVYTITFTSSLENFESHTDDFNAMLENFRFK